MKPNKLRRKFRSDNVLEAARKRISFIFDEFKEITVSISSGKDSTVLFWLCLQEARLRDRQIKVFFLDQEAEYQSSIDIIELSMREKNVVPYWYQVPAYMTNSSSSSDYFLYAWGEGEKWLREKSDISIHSIEEEYPKRFYKFFEWFESKTPEDAHLVGLRAEESITRYRAATKRDGWGGLKWSTLSQDSQRFYPIYDWAVYDVWKFIYDYDLPYNRIYDLMFLDGYSIYSKMRVSNLIHEKSFRCLVDLPRYEPDTYNNLCKRISGISTASRYATEKLVFDNKTLPKHYKTWKQFRDFLLENIQDQKAKSRFTKRFGNQEESERVFKGQVGQLLLNDFENSRTFDTAREKSRQRTQDKWRELLR